MSERNSSGEKREIDELFLGRTNDLTLPHGQAGLGDESSWKPIEDFRVHYGNHLIDGELVGSPEVGSGVNFDE